MQHKRKKMELARILNDGRLWAVQYDGDEDNCFDNLFTHWFDISWLKDFFKNNLEDLTSFFKITDIYQAISETLVEAEKLECLILDISPEANLDILFKHLENSRFTEMSLGKEKARGTGTSQHPSWLRIYAIKMEPGIYLVIGGAIKLTATMAERSHTLAELARLEQVRNYLIDNGVFDLDGLIDYTDHE